MEFYRDISYYYDSIFPYKEGTYMFLLDCASSVDNKDINEIKVLDVACGSGTYALALSSRVKEIVGNDLDESMINQALEKDKNHKVDFSSLNMLDIEKLGAESKTFDFIYCIGNSIVHLDSMEEVSQFLNKAYDLLTKGGNLALQLINYNRILDLHIDGLPTIVNEDDGISFQRDYIHHLTTNKIEFKTQLVVETERISERFEQSVDLLPVQVDDLYAALTSTGFSDIEIFGGFDKSAYNKKTSYAIVVKAHK